MASGQSTLPSVRGVQLRTALSLLLVVAVAAITLDLGARNDRLLAWLDRRDENFCLKTGTIFEYRITMTIT